MGFMTYFAVCAAVCAAFAFAWWRALKRDNWSAVDVVRALAPPAGALAMALSAGTWRACVWAAALALWGLRLAAHRHAAVHGRRDREDPRHTALRTRWGESAPMRMFWVYQANAAAVAVLLLVPFSAGLDTAPQVHTAEVAGFAFALVAFAGVTLADRQLARFRALPANRDRICERGLWAYSRHPNYFFEAALWCGLALAAAESPFALLACAAPVMMVWLLTCVTGVPVLEARALARHGDAWRDYAARVSEFFPWPRRRRK